MKNSTNYLNCFNHSNRNELNKTDEALNKRVNNAKVVFAILAIIITFAYLVA